MIFVIFPSICFYSREEGEKRKAKEIHPLLQPPRRSPYLPSGPLVGRGRSGEANTGGPWSASTCAVVSPFPGVKKGGRKKVSDGRQAVDGPDGTARRQLAHPSNSTEQTPPEGKEGLSLFCHFPQLFVEGRKGGGRGKGGRGEKKTRYSGPRHYH